MGSVEQRPAGSDRGGDSKSHEWRRGTSEVLGVAGLVFYNWWVVVPFVHGMLPSYNGFFSDIEASGLPHATLLQHLDLLSGILLLTALALRGSIGRQYRGREWGWLVGFAIAAGAGGKFSYACSSGLSAVCRAQERRLQLPLHHYVHMLSGVLEFATITTAVFLAVRRTRGQRTGSALVYRTVLRIFLRGLPAPGPGLPDRPRGRLHRARLLPVVHPGHRYPSVPGRSQRRGDPGRPRHAANEVPGSPRRPGGLIATGGGPGSI